MNSAIRDDRAAFRMKHADDQTMMEAGHSILKLEVLETSHRPGGRIRKSKNGPRRAFVLVIVQLLIIAHVVQWWITGTTISPIEPSEAMELGRSGRINAGLIFFALALLSTLVLGRWFCGWGCHLVLLQDFCGWIMKKCGIRPKPFRARLLMYIPLILGLYMFIWPAFYRLAVAPWTNPDLSWPGFTLHLTTGTFWQTFPGMTLAVPFLLICGFGTVYFLGAKGFCTYACPYGGFFAPLDELAPARIIVSDDCDQAGHCTAVCTSNVRVNEEVREYGMVVDPGCMKCLDCVSVCPNGALSFGFKKPAVMKRKAKNKKPVPHYDLTMPEEIVFSLLFALTFFSLRGDVVRFPLLMTAAMASILTFMFWKLCRMRREETVTLHRFHLKQGGKIRTAGVVYGGSVLLCVLLTLHSGLVNLAFRNAERHYKKVTIPLETVFADQPFEIPDPMRDSIVRSIRWYRLSSDFSRGGISFTTSTETLVRLAWLESCRSDFNAALEYMTQAVNKPNPGPGQYEDLALILEKLERPEEAARYRSLARVEKRETGTLME